MISFPFKVHVVTFLRSNRIIRIKKNYFLDLKYLSWNLFADENLEAFIQQVMYANRRGVSASRNVSTEPNWSIGQAVFFAGTVLTTIGKTFRDVRLQKSSSKNFTVLKEMYRILH